jgi:hypothetical protein
MPNPFIPAGSLIAERQRRNRTQFKVAVYAVLAAHAMLVLGLLFVGCKSDEPGVSGYEPAGQAVATPAPTPPAPAQPPAPAAAPRSAHPVSVAQPPANGELIYVVKSGDTVPRIAKAHGTTVQALRAANALKNDHLVVGMKLKLPAKTG